MPHGSLSSYLSLPLIGTAHTTRESPFQGAAFIERFDDVAGSCLFIGRWRFTFNKGQRPAGVPVLVATGCALALTYAACGLTILGFRRLYATVVGHRPYAEDEGQS